jgi:protein-disulfide isomerase-like protein with CxxC motif
MRRGGSRRISPSCRSYSPPSDVGCAMKTSAMFAMGKFLRLSYQTALMDTEEAIGLVVFGALICVFILLVAVVL